MKKQFTLKSQTEELKPLRGKLESLLKSSSLGPKDIENILIAVTEACTNSIRHAYGEEPNHKIDVALEDLPRKVVISIRDYGKKIDLVRISKPPQIPPVNPGGLGIHFMKTMMDMVEIKTDHENGNEFVFTKYKPKENQ